LAYGVDELDITRQRRFPAGDPDLIKIGQRWEQALRQAVQRLPEVRLLSSGAATPQGESIQIVERSSPDGAAELPAPAAQRPPA
jgi:predicted proteasome-type protease